VPVNVDGGAVLVTGASSGIGAATARLLAARGARVGIVARRRDRLEEVLDDCRRTSPECAMWVADLSDPDAAAALADEAWDALGGLDALVNNAAVPKRRHATELTAEEIEGVMRTNFFSPTRMTLAVLPRMLERGRGVIVNVSSLGGRLGIAGEAAYCASKFALTGWSEALAVDLWDTPVDVRLITPGAIDTEIWDQPENDEPLYRGEKEPAETVAAAIVDAIEGEGFETYVPDMKAVIEFKTADTDTFLGGVADMARQVHSS
jgi:short-subunit dehydrogenase